MGGIYLLRDHEDGSAHPSQGAIQRRYRAQGFDDGVVLDLDGWRGRHFEFAVGGPEGLYHHGTDLIAVAGTLAYDGQMGRAALAALLADAAPPSLDWSRLAGQFVALVRKAGRSFLFTDYFAAFQLFRSADGRVVSTSLLGMLDAVPHVRFDRQGLYEYAFNIAPIGDRTVFADITMLGPGTMLELVPGGSILHPLVKPLPGAIVVESLADRIERHRHHLAAVIAPHLDWFGDHVRCALSGGLDSRLVLAALRAGGCRPTTYVYGPPHSADVRASTAIGATLGFPVEHIDKSEHPLDSDTFPAEVTRAFHQLDGLPNFGNIFDGGANVAAMAARHADGVLAASGGCGEVYRDFFFLRDRPLTPAVLASTFFARFTARDATALFDPRQFLDAIADEIAAGLGVSRTDKVPRVLIEQAYPRIRCRALFGREISTEARYSAYLMPFLDHQLVADAVGLPLVLKQAGAFEGMLLNAISPELARLPSAYGHHFAEPPSRAHRRAEWSTRIRPTWLRRHSYALQRRLRPVVDDHGHLPAPDLMSMVLDPDMPIMRRYFALDQVADGGLLRRIACLEYLAEQLGSQLKS